MHHSHNTKVLRNKKLKAKVNLIVEQVMKDQRGITSIAQLFLYLNAV